MAPPKKDSNPKKRSQSKKGVPEDINFLAKSFGLNLDSIKHEMATEIKGSIVNDFLAVTESIGAKFEESLKLIASKIAEMEGKLSKVNQLEDGFKVAVSKFNEIQQGLPDKVQGMITNAFEANKEPFAKYVIDYATGAFGGGGGNGDQSPDNPQAMASVTSLVAKQQDWTQLLPLIEKIFVGGSDGGAEAFIKQFERWDNIINRIRGNQEPTQTQLFGFGEKMLSEGVKLGIKAKQALPKVPGEQSPVPRKVSTSPKRTVTPDDLDL